MIGNLTWRTLFMRSLLPCSTAMVAVIALISAASAQQPPEKDLSNSPIVTRMMAFNKKKDGKLTKDEVTDTRLKRLFDEADANKDGVVTKEELMALAVKLEAEDGPGGQGGRGGPGGGPGGPGGPGGRGPGGPGGRGQGGPGGFGGRPQPGQILPPFMIEALKLTPEQRKKLDELQKDVDSRLGKILTEEQMKQMKA